MTTKADDENLLSGFVESARRYGERPALHVNGKHHSYEFLAQMCSRIAATISRHERASTSALGAVFAHRSLTAYAGVLGVLASGRGYVPLSPKFPIARTQKMLRASGAEVVVVGQECLAQFTELLEVGMPPTTVLLPEVADVSGLESQFPVHRFFSEHSLGSAPPVPGLPSAAGDEVAYLLFTSGSTGDPKGVPVSHRNVRSYVEFAADRYEVRCEDRVSQTFDLTFDLSVHDMFVSWQRGACVCCVPESLIFAPARFIREQELTLWFSVPSVVGFMSRLRLLRPGLFPQLRCSLFCGEPLPEKSVVAWQASAPNSVIENLYGPTEATIAFTYYRWDPSVSPAVCMNGIVPIGWPFDGQRTRVIGSDMRPVPTGQPGELLLSGSQVTRGYWKDADKTLERYVKLPDDDGATWYRTGDRVVEGEDGCLSYLGRFDDQVKIHGFRVELQEIDFVVREASDSEQVVSIAWPVHDGSADGVVTFVCGASDKDAAKILQHCRSSLPDYMIPRQILFVDEMPLSANGKISRSKLIQSLEEGRL